MERKQNPGLAGLLLEEANRRGGIVGHKVRAVVDALPLPAADEAAETLAVIHQMGKNLDSAWHRLNTGKPDVWEQSQAAAARYREESAA